MKILQLKLKNIQSLAGEHLIPFGSATFTQHGIFLICGPTGSGKTTILDAICMALYESAPRMGKLSVADIDGQGMLVTRNALHAFTELEYEMGGGNRYKSIWKAERTARSSSFGASHIKMELYQWVQNQWQLISDKKAEVIKNNESIIGLDFNQFRMAVLLAQGDFAKLLKADATTRSELLERVTGKTIFKKIGALIFAKTAEIKNEKSLLLARSGGVVLLTDEEIAQRNIKIETLNQNIHLQFKQIQEILAGIDWWKTDENLQLKTEHIGQLTLELEQLRQKFQDHAPLLDQHEKASPLIPKIEKWNIEHSKINEAQKQISDLSNLNQNIENEFADLLVRISSMCPFPLSEQTWINELQIKKTEAANERDEIYQLRNTSNEKKERIHAILQPWEWTVEKPINEATVWLKEKQNQWKNLPFSIESLPNQINILENQKNQALVWQQKCFAESEINKEISQAQHLILTLTDEKNTWVEKDHALKNEFNEVATQVHVLQFEVQGLRNFASAAELRATLVNQQPCPVCGSIDHPFSTMQFDASLKEAEEKLRALTEMYSEIQSNISSIEKTIQEIETKLFFQNQQITSLNLKKQEHIEAISSLQIPSFPTAEDALKYIDDTLPTYKSIFFETTQYKAIESILPDWETYELLQKQIEVKTNAYFKLFPKDFIALAEQWIQEGMLLKQRSSDTKEQLQVKKEAWNALQNENTLLELELNQQAIQYGFENYTHAKAALQSQELAQLWRNELLQISSLEKSIQDQNQNLIEEITQHQKNIQPKSKKEELEAEYQQLNAERINLVSEKGAWEEQLKMNENNRLIFKEYQNQIHEIDEKLGYWEILNNKIGDKNGNKFSKIAQQFTLDLLIQLANVKLKEFRARYQLHLEKQEDGLGKIMVIDEFLGGQLRNVETLSGGETFLTSLSLAMALSDFAANNAQLNTLFIDEGFGTLDPDSLANAMEAIDQIRTTSQKTIGLISHVQELRERIACQIEVIPKGNGKSILEIRG